DGAVGAQHVPVLRLPQLRYERILLGAHGWPIRPPIGRGDSPESVMDPAVLRFGRADESLGGHAADVHTSPAERTALDQADPSAKLGPLDGGGESRRAATHDRDVELASLHAHFPWTVAPKPVSRVRSAAIWAPAVWIPPPHNGQRNAVPLSPAASNNPAFTDGNMFNLLPDESGRRTSRSS